MKEDKLVTAIFAAIKKESAHSAKERQHAIIRAGHIAQAYLGTSEELLESTFGSADTFQNDVEKSGNATH